MKEIKCMTCGKHLEPKEVCKPFGYPQCLDCAFPNIRDKEKALKMVTELNQINESLKKKHNKMCTKKMIIGQLVIFAIMLITILLTGKENFWRGIIPESILFFIWTGIAFAKPFKPMTFREYCNLSNEINNDVNEKQNKETYQKPQEKSFVANFSERHTADDKPKSEERTHKPANSNRYNSSSNNISDITIPKQKKIHKSNKVIVVILSITTALFGLAAIGLTAGLISIQSDNKNLSAEISDLEASIGVKDDEISRLDREAMNQRGTINTLQNKLNFYDAHVVCVNDGDTYYHKPDCLYFDESSFYIYNIEAAIVRGYKECPYCYK